MTKEGIGEWDERIEVYMGGEREIMRGMERRSNGRMREED